MTVTVWTDLFMHCYLCRIQDVWAPLRRLSQELAEQKLARENPMYFYSIDQQAFLDPEKSAAENGIGMHEQIVLISGEEARISGIEADWNENRKGQKEK